jgi:NADH:ubiquinone oxidoreductase subunit 2 (subunit N)
LNVVRQIFFEKADEDATPIKVPVGVAIALIVSAAAVVVVGVYPQPFLEFATDSIQMLGMVF